MNRTFFLLLCVILVPVLAWQSWELFISPRSTKPASAAPPLRPSQSPLYSRLESSKPGEVIIIWPAPDGTATKVVIDLDKKSFTEEPIASASSGVVDVKPQEEGSRLTDEQIFRLKELLKKLPAGQMFDQTPFFTSQLHIAYCEGNLRLIRHYSIYHLPPETAQLGAVLGLALPGTTKTAK